MVRISLSNDQVVVDIEGWDRIWALRSGLSFPLNSVRSIVCDPLSAWAPRGLRLVGTSLPGVVRAGIFWFPGELSFWVVHDPRNALVLELSGQRFARVVLEVPDPKASMAFLQSAL